MITVNNSISKQENRLAVESKNVLSIFDEDIVCIYRLYFDESGTHNQSEFMYVAGCMMEKRSWDALCDSWAPILEELGITRFRASKCNAGKGEFKGWTQEKIDNTFDRFVEKINEHDYNIIRVGLKKELFSSVAKEFPDVVVSPYELSVIWCVLNGGILPKIIDKPGDVGLLFEDGQDVRFHVRQYIAGISKRSDYPTTAMAFQFKENLIPYQVADLIAWEYLQYINNYIKSKDIPMRRTLAALAEKKERFVSKDYIGESHRRDLMMMFDIIRRANPNGFAPPN